METKKITAEQLMIGDWVMFTDPADGSKYPVQIKGINANSYCSFGDKYLLNIINDLEPIPLTAEILEKNGFAELMKHDEWSRIFRAYQDDLFIEVGIYEPMFINIGYVDKEGEEQPLSDIVKIDGENFYLHELQHALRLVGINDKEIVL